MPFRFEEKPGSRNQPTSMSEERNYFASGSSDPNFVRAIVESSTPLVIVTLTGILYRQTNDIDIKTNGSPDFWDITVKYGIENQDDDEQSGGLGFDLDFTTTGGTVNIKAGLEHKATYPAIGDPDRHKGAIGVHGKEVDGCEIVIPALKLTFKVTHRPGVQNMARIRSLARNTGRTNITPFATFDAGECLFLGCNGKLGLAQRVEATYEVACSENLANEVIGGITVIEKKGWDVAWIQFKDNVAATAAARQPQFIHVERVYKSIDLAGLLGFG
jgi:hypothetical protein